MGRDAVDRVADDETLLRGVHDHWLDARGLPTTAAFPVADLNNPARKGISVHRVSRTGAGEIPTSLGRRWPVHVDATAAAVRSILSEAGCQAFEIDPAPTAEDVGHALVRFADPSNPPDSPRFERDKLLDVFRRPDTAHE